MEWFFTQYIGTCRPNLIGNPSAGQGSKTRSQLEQQYWNPNAFEASFGSAPAIIALATNGTPAQKDLHNEFWRFGTAGYTLGNARQPGFWNADVALSKDFNFTETKYLQLRFEVYNFFNHMNLGIPNDTWCLPPNADGTTDAVHKFGCSFGKISSIQTDPRSMQVGLKLVF